MYFLKLIIILLALFIAKIYYAYNATIYNESKPRLISLEVVLILPDDKIINVSCDCMLPFKMPQSL